MREVFILVLISLVLFIKPSLSFSATTQRNVAVVTGASGFLGREIVKELLADDSPNKEIVCLVRQSRVEEEKKYWDTFQHECSEQNCDLRVLPYDMIDGGVTLTRALQSIVSRNAGHDVECCIYHIASIFTPTDDHEKMALDNVQGSEDMMRSASKFSGKSIKVVFTSSMAAVRGTGQMPLNEKFYTHEDYNTLSSLGKNWGSSYQWSKAQSEKRLWDLAKQNNIPFISLCPSFIFGPPSDAKSSKSFSLSIVSDWIRGKSPVQSRLCVDVRDVAKAHVIAGKAKEAVNQRIIVSTEARVPSTSMAEELKRISKEFGIGDPEKIHADTEFDGGIIQIGQQEVQCTDRLKYLLNGLEPRSVEETMADMATALLEQERSKQGSI